MFGGENGASTKERMDAATWLTDRGFGKPTVDSWTDAAGFGDFTIVMDSNIQDNGNLPIEP